jgi:hypothetical protein
MSLWGAQYDEWSPRRKKQTAMRALFAAAFFLAVGAFAAGYFWKANSSRVLRSAPPQDAASATSERKQALDFIDEAIRAKHEKRTSGALAALDRARKTDPSAPGLDVAFAELALNEKQFIEMRAAAEAAKRKDDHAAGASVLLGMDKWLTRGASDREMSAAADAASTHFAEASKSDYFYAHAWFFWGDVLRYAGREEEGRDRALAALHRFNPWESSDVIAAKIVFASAEAGVPIFGSLGAGEASLWAQAVEDLGARSPGERQSLTLPVPFAARQTLLSLTADPFISGLK